MGGSHVWTVDPADSRFGHRRQRVLVVDDERDTVIALLALLQLAGYDASGAYDGPSALKEVEEFDPDVALVDIAMPRMTGWDVAREVRKRNLHRPVLIAVSGSYLKPPDAILCRVAGFSHFLMKPCDPNELMKFIGAPTRATP